MAIDVTVTRIVLGGRWPVVGEPVIYPKVSRVIVKEGVLNLYHVGNAHPYGEVHYVSMPLSTVWEWVEGNG